MAEIAKNVVIGKHGITIDGEEFPYFIAEETITVSLEPGDPFSYVTFTILAEEVYVNGEDSREGALIGCSCSAE